MTPSPRQGCVREPRSQRFSCCSSGGSGAVTTCVESPRYGSPTSTKKVPHASSGRAAVCLRRISHGVFGGFLHFHFYLDILKMSCDIHLQSYDGSGPAMHSQIRLRSEGVSIMWPLTHISTGLDPKRGMIIANGI